MDSFLELFNQSGFAHLGWGNWVMFLVAGVLMFLAITREYEPLLLIPISFGIVLANFPLADLGSYGEGIIALIYESGIKTELLPPIIFLGVGVNRFQALTRPPNDISAWSGCPNRYFCGSNWRCLSVWFYF
jgi:oxaloacetate decarboxylase beta subunit